MNKKCSPFVKRSLGTRSRRSTTPARFAVAAIVWAFAVTPVVLPVANADTRSAPAANGMAPQLKTVYTDIPALAVKVCTAPVLTNNVVTGYKPFHDAAIRALREQLGQCYQLLQKLVDDRNPPTITPAKPLTGAQVALCNPARVSLSDDPTVIAALINSYCSGLVAIRRPAPWQVTPAQLIFTARNPTLYVLTSAGGGPPSSAVAGSAASPSASGTGSTTTLGANSTPLTLSPAVSAPATTPTGAISNNDSLLLFLVAEQLEDQYCVNIHAALTEHGKHCAPSALMNFERPLAVVPEGQWNLEDFRTQCAGDPFLLDADGHPHGTVGAIVLNGTTATSDGTFSVLTVTGRAEANYSVEAVSCYEMAASGSAVEELWNQKVRADGSRPRTSMYIPSLFAAVAAANIVAKSAFIPQPTVNAPTQTIEAYTGSQEAVVIGQFAGASSGLVLGNPSSALAMIDTLRHLAGKIGDGFDASCKASDFKPLPVCAMYMIRPPDQSPAVDPIGAKP